MFLFFFSDWTFISWRSCSVSLSERVQALRYLQLTRQLLSCSADGGIAVWNMDTQREEVCFPIITAAKIKGVMIQSAQSFVNNRFRVYSVIYYMPLFCWFNIYTFSKGFYSLQILIGLFYMQFLLFHVDVISHYFIVSMQLITQCSVLSPSCPQTLMCHTT